MKNKITMIFSVLCIGILVLCMILKPGMNQKQSSADETAQQDNSGQAAHKDISEPDSEPAEELPVIPDAAAESGNDFAEQAAESKPAENEEVPSDEAASDNNELPIIP